MTIPTLKIPSRLEKIEDALFGNSGLELYLKRDDLIHPDISGNKWRKLKYNFHAAITGNHTTLLTFGGAWSNHIHATAAAGRMTGIQTIGVIRGERPPVLSATLEWAEAQGMRLVFITREAYRQKETTGFLETMEKEFGRYYLVPEGGANEAGVAGAEEIVPEIGIPFDHLCIACGTGTTYTGLLRSAWEKKITGFSALRNGEYLLGSIRKEAGFDSGRHTITSVYAGKGYAASSPELEDFICRFFEKHEILLDPVYTGKMMQGIYDLAGKGYFPAGSRIVAVHTGGLQGIAGFPDLHRKLFKR